MRRSESDAFQKKNRFDMVPMMKMRSDRSLHRLREEEEQEEPPKISKNFLKATVLGGYEGQKKMCIGKLGVRVVEAAHLPSADLNGSSDPYVVVRVNDQTFRTKTVKKNLCPQFRESFAFGIWRYDDVLQVDVFDSDDQSADDFLGGVHVQVADLAGLGIVRRWWRLECRAPSAAVHLHLEYECSAVGEALSYFWVDPPLPPKDHKFEINSFYASATKLKELAEPVGVAATAFNEAVRWTHPRSGWAFVAALGLGVWIDRFFEFFHYAIVALMCWTLRRKLRWRGFKNRASYLFDLYEKDGLLEKRDVDRAIQELSSSSSSSSSSSIDAPEGGVMTRDEFDRLIERAFSGVPRKAINIAGRKAGGRDLAYAAFLLEDVAKQLEYFTRVLSWSDFSLSVPCFCANLVLAYLHRFVPLRYFAVPGICCMFGYYSEKRIFLERFVSRAPIAYDRYRALKTKKGLKTLPDTHMPVPTHKPTRILHREAHRKKSLKLLLQALFSRLDVDGSGTIDADELKDFVTRAGERATPKAKTALGSQVPARVDALVSQLDVNGDGEIDFCEFSEMLSTQASFADVLIQDELLRQLRDPDGFKCVKLPANQPYFKNIGAHHTNLALLDRGLSYKNRHGDTCVVSHVALVKPVGDHGIDVDYTDDHDKTKPLHLNVPDCLRDPLIDILRHHLCAAGAARRS
ncbi:hypothetical protein CTAYLR_007476 [Chrysophaeum taylorii]|uniref:Calmodulin n=1 Tax=Chrysophaeum taylorii TaxID=2483200 RepID=A0AAD7UC24_9STRA|nr:hypothetical protein CTAYLR_007476 [Chrysophaeum taylorii]